MLANRRFEVLMCLASDQVYGKVDDEIFPKETADLIRANDRVALELGRPFESEEVVSHDDGPHTYLSTRFPVRDAAGVIYAVGGISTDITERTRAERALRASEQRFRTLCHCSPIGIFLTDHEGRCTYTNPRCQEIYGFEPDEALGEGWSRFIHPEDRGRVMDAMVASRPPAASSRWSIGRWGPRGGSVGSMTGRRPCSRTGAS